MKQRTYLFWLGEFACVTAIGIIPATKKPLYWIIVPAVLLVVLKALEYRTHTRHQHQTVRSLLDLLDVFLPYGDADLRCTYHVPVKGWISRKVKLVQAFDYIPKGGGAGRKFSLNKGIIGKAFQVRGPRVENFQSPEEYRKRMLSEYGYSEAELGERNPDRRSYLAYPIVEGGNERVEGILYLDSNTFGTFSIDDTNQMWQMIRNAVQPIRRALES